MASPPHRQSRRDRPPHHPHRAKMLGIRTIAVYSEPMPALPFVREADEAVPSARSPARESYLAQEKIIGRRRKPAPRRSIPATASCRRTPSSPRRWTRPA